MRQLLRMVTRFSRPIDFYSSSIRPVGPALRRHGLALRGSFAALATVVACSLPGRTAVAEAASPADAATPTAAPAADPTIAEPFAFGDFSWIPGNAGSSVKPLSSGAFTGEFRVDVPYHYSFNQPKDNTISGSSEVFRHGEFQLTQLGIGGDFHHGNVHGRLMTQFGMYSTTTPRNDASTSRGQWRLDDAYRYISEGYAGYRVPVGSGFANIQAGIFMSYVGLWSYYNFDNWTYQPSYVSSNTPWFFNGVRVQYYPSDKLKIEPWVVNGWQAYGKFNDAPGLGLQILWRPNSSVSLLGNQYYGSDALGLPDRKRFHSDDSLMVKYHEKKGAFINRAAASLTLDAGFETGAGVGMSDQYFLGFMAYNRLWFDDNKFGLTVGGGAIKNPGRYLVLVPPVNGANALSCGGSSFTCNKGDPYVAWDTQITADWMPEEFITFRLEFNHRQASVPYFSGPGGVTPPGGNQGAPGSDVPGWAPDLVKSEDRITAALMLKL